MRSQQEIQERLTIQQIVSAYASDDADKAEFIRSAIEDTLQAARSNVEQWAR